MADDRKIMMTRLEGGEYFMRVVDRSEVNLKEGPRSRKEGFTMRRFWNNLLSLLLFVLVFGLMSLPNLVQAQQKEAPTQYVPCLIYRTGPLPQAAAGLGVDGKT